MRRKIIYVEESARVCRFGGWALQEPAAPLSLP